MGNGKLVVIGAGPVGSLAALYAAQRGFDVEIYELRSDLRHPSTTPLNFTKSINLALSERGINAMRHAGSEKLIQDVFSATIPMRGRMIHGKQPSGEVYQEAQDYDVHGRTIFAVDRGDLNKRLLDILELMPNVNFFFNHKLTGADFRKRKAWLEVSDGTKTATGRHKEIAIDFDFMIGADGAHSAVRYHMMKYSRVNYQQDYIDTLWCEFTMKPNKTQDPARADSKFAISPHHLHIWPGKQFMFIAIPSEDGSFTCTLFLPSGNFEDLEAKPDQLPDFFDRNFPGVTALIPPEDLVLQFKTNPHLPLISIKCSPYHYSSSAVIIGDAAHAMVPFYGQGMNAGLEDVRILFSILDKHAAFEDNNPLGSQPLDPAMQRAAALAKYSAIRSPDAYAINDLALQNYVEMRSSVLSPAYLLRKKLEEWLSVHVPSLGWQTQYSRVSFGNERYSDVIAKSNHQRRVLTRWIELAGGTTMVLLLLAFYYARNSRPLGKSSFLASLRRFIEGFWR